MVVSAQPVAPSFGTVEPTLILPPARSALTWYGQEVEATTPSEVKSSTCAAAVAPVFVDDLALRAQQLDRRVELRLGQRIGIR